MNCTTGCPLLHRQTWFVRALPSIAAAVAIGGAAAMGEPEHPPIRRAPATKTVSHREGFEGDPRRLTLWAKNGESVASFNGVTDEKAFEGSKSLKLDVTAKGGSYHYWGIALRAPCAGSLKLSARVLVAEGTTARVGFGGNAVFPPTALSGCAPVKTFDKPTGKWELIEIDLPVAGRAMADMVLATHTATAGGEDVGVYMDRWSLFIYGGSGKRAVVYVDDVRLEGQAPAEAEYGQEIDRRWAGGQARLGRRIEEWRRRVAAAEDAIGKLPPSLRTVAQSFDTTAVGERKRIDALAARGYGGVGEVGSIERSLVAAEGTPETARAVAKAKRDGRPYLLYAMRAITNDRFPVDAFAIPRPPAKTLRCAGCRGEYESVSVGAFALENVKGLRVTVGDLKGPAGTIPADAVDVHVVKSWYQAGKEIWDAKDDKNKMYVPELLLKDDRLVRVDRKAQQNYLRSTAPDGTEQYLLCSGPTSDNLKDVRPIDADSLLPVDIVANSFKQFWLTVHIPEDAAAGSYEGTVSFTTESGSAAMPLTVAVHPFDLQPSRVIYSIYYRAMLSEDGEPTIGSELKSERQYRVEMADFKAHGVLYPTNYQGWDEKLLPRVMEIRREVGMPGGPFYNLGQNTGSTTDPAKLGALRADVKRWIEFCKPFGYDTVYFYGVDEATGDRLKAQRASWKAVQDAGGKTFVACYEKTFETMGNLLDCAVLARRPSPEEAEKWHGVRSQIFCYAYPQVGNEEPETYRRNFGLVLWKAGYDGAMDYAYQHGFNHVWNDFDYPTYRDHNFTYPTVNGIVGTIQWEGFREAVDDVRYVTTLEKAIRDAPAPKRSVAKQAQAWLDALDPDSADLYGIREKMVEWIEKLR